jgi:transposase
MKTPIHAHFISLVAGEERMGGPGVAHAFVCLPKYYPYRYNLALLVISHSQPALAMRCALLAGGALLRRGVAGGFSAGPMRAMSRNSIPCHQRRHQGSTSPPLVNVELNPGPHSKKPPSHARVDHQSLDHNLGEEERMDLMDLFEEGLGPTEVARLTGMQEETVTRWYVRWQETGALKPRKSPGRPLKKRSAEDAAVVKAERCVSRGKKRHKQMDARDHGLVEAGIEWGVPERDIAARVGRAPSTIHSCKERLAAGESLERKPGSGAGRKTTERDDRYFKLTVLKDKSGNTYAPQAAEGVRDSEDNILLQPRNVQNRLHEQGLGTKKKVKKPALSKDHKKRRREWAKEHQDWPLSRWQGILWSDESSFTLQPAPRCRRVWTVRGRRGLDPRQIEETKKHGGGHINVWGCFSASGLGSLKWVKETMKAKNYHSILKNQVLPELRKMSAQQPEIVFLFQHDNASVHTAKKCKKYLKTKEDSEGFSVLDWPAQSPDLAPIENLWSILKFQLKMREKKPTTKEELWNQLVEEWEKLQSDLLTRLVDSMPQRCKDVLAAGGGATHH